MDPRDKWQGFDTIDAFTRHFSYYHGHLHYDRNQNLSNLLFPVCSHVNIPNSFIRTKIASVGSAVNST